jgi:hypothetical protein
MPDRIPPVRQALEELDDYANDVRRSSHHTVTNAVQRYVARMDSEPLASLGLAVLPPTDFDTWYTSARATIGSMVGSGELNWPVPTADRVALQAELLRRIAGGQIDLVEYTYDFHYIENRFDTNIAQFVTQDFEPFHRDFVRLLLSEVERTEAEPQLAPPEPVAPPLPIPLAPTLNEYIAHSRLTELRALRPGAFDLRKLVRLCEEIDLCFRNQSFLAVAALTRALLDHVPPIFGHSSFSEVANNYSGGGRSFKEQMQHLQNSARRIGDAHLHVQIRSSESLPTSTQVNFSNDLDVMLAEIVRVLR